MQNCSIEQILSIADIAVALVTGIALGSAESTLTDSSPSQVKSEQPSRAPRVRASSQALELSTIPLMGCVEGGEIVEARPGPMVVRQSASMKWTRLGVAEVQKVQRAHEVSPRPTVTKVWPTMAENGLLTTAINEFRRPRVRLVMLLSCLE